MPGGGTVRGSFLATVAAAAMLAGLNGCGGGGGPQATTTGHVVTTATVTSVTTVLPGTGRPQITLGDKNTPEQFVLGALYDLALTNEGFDVAPTRNIGPTSVSYQALEQGSLDMYPEYLNVWNSQVAGHVKPSRSLVSSYRAGQRWAERHGLELLRPTPFSDTAGLAVTAGYASAYQLHTLEDLRTVATSMTLGVPLEFKQDPFGLPALEQEYGFQPASTVSVDIGSQYDELRTGTIQAAYVGTTDAQLAGGEFTVLADPHHVNGFGNVVPVVSRATLAAEGPAFVATINQIDALLTTPVMRRLNADVELLHEDPTKVARQFLQAHGLLPASTSA